MLHRNRAALASSNGRPFSENGPVEVDETYIGGLERNKHEKRKLKAGRGTVGKAAVVGARNRKTGKVAARVIDRMDKRTLGGFVDKHVAPDAPLYTDDSSSYSETDRPHETVKHTAREYVRYLKGETVHTNGVESFWATLKRAYKRTFHRLSVKHLQRYMDEFAARHNVRELDTLDQMARVAAGMIGRRLMYGI